MSNSLINVVKNLNCKNIIKIFCCPVSLNCRNNAVTKNFSCTLTATKLNIFFIKPCLNYRQGFFCDILMYKNSFNRIANRWARSFCIIYNVCSHINIRTFINKNMAVANTSFDNRNFCIFNNSFDKTCTTTRNEQIKIINKSHKFNR